MRAQKAALLILTSTHPFSQAQPTNAHRMYTLDEGGVLWMAMVGVGGLSVARRATPHEQKGPKNTGPTSSFAPLPHLRKAMESGV